MDADLDLLLTTVYVTADDLLPEEPENAKPSITEVVTLCVAQASMGIPSDRRFLAVASKRLRHLFPRVPGQAGYFQAPPSIHRHAGVADGGLRQSVPRVLR
jgi:hypothetical protein